MSCRRNALLLLSSILLLSGCGGNDELTDADLIKMSGGELKETVPVSGKVMVDGAPAGKVTIFAYTEQSGRKPAADCRTKADGTYCWNTYRDCDGLPPEDYLIAFELRKSNKGRPGEGDLFGGKYANAVQNDMSLKVESGKPLTDVNYELATN